MATDCDIETRKVRLSPHRGLLAIGVCYSVFLIDQISKWIILHVLVPGETIPVIPKLLSLTLAHNRGMAFGLLQGRTGFLSLVSLIAALVLPVVIARTLRQGDRIPAAVGLALILAGDLGNLLDRLLRKNGVVDFIDFHIGDVADPLWRWFPFNVADSAICIGVGLYILASWRFDHTPTPNPRPLTSDSRTVDRDRRD
jgi:signal peptidase II